MRTCCVAFLVLVAVSLASPAIAQTPRAGGQESEDDKKRAVKDLGEGDKALARGDKLMKKGQMEQALEAYEAGLSAYQRALQAFPSPKIYFPIAQAEQKLGRFIEALHHYEQVLAEAEEVPDALRDQIKVAVAEVKRNLAGLDLAVEPDGAMIQVDGNKLGTSPLAKPHFLEPGKHTLTVTADGHTPFEQAIDLSPGKVSPKKVVLKRMPVAVADEDGDEDERPLPAVTAPSRNGLLVLIGATTALTLGATITGVAAVGKHGTFEDPDASSDDRASAKSSGKKLAITTDVLALGAIAAGAYTTYYYLKVYKPRRDVYEEDLASAAVPGLWLSPWADGDGGGLALGGGF